MTNRFVNEMSRLEILTELAQLRDDDGLDHAGELHGRTVGDPSQLGDDDLRELLKLARARALLWRRLDE